MLALSSIHFSGQLSMCTGWSQKGVHQYTLLFKQAWQWASAGWRDVTEHYPLQWLEGLDTSGTIQSAEEGVPFKQFPEWHMAQMRWRAPCKLVLSREGMAVYQRVLHQPLPFVSRLKRYKSVQYQPTLDFFGCPFKTPVPALMYQMVPRVGWLKEGIQAGDRVSIIELDARYTFEIPDFSLHAHCLGQSYPFRWDTLFWEREMRCIALCARAAIPWPLLGKNRPSTVHVEQVPFF